MASGYGTEMETAALLDHPTAHRELASFMLVVLAVGRHSND